jgi:tRNA pseudouridine55 synthase
VHVQPTQPLSGLLLVDKPAGLTSARVVDRVKRLLPRGTKVGHAGTLDPFATGLLILLVGRATRLCEEVMGRPKTYLATVKLGATTETDDPETPERPWPSAPVRPAMPEEVSRVLPRFVGEISQLPPKFSALKIAGRRAADRVRAGEDVRMRPRTIRVYSIEPLDYAWPLLRLKVHCGRGTYVRAIARDVGEQLGVGGYLTELRRTRIGEHDVAAARTLEQLQSTPLEVALIPMTP